MLNRFSAGLPGKLIKDITRKNLLDHMSILREEGLGAAQFSTTSTGSTYY
jgi:hypothetical protein